METTEKFAVEKKPKLTPEEKLAELISRDSPFFQFYASNPSMDQILHVDPRALEEAPSFKDALHAQILITGIPAGTLGRRVCGVGGDHGFVSRIIAGGINYNGDSRHPIMNSTRFLGLSDTVGEGEEPEKHERIPVLFYDSKTGDLVLRKNNRNRDSKALTSTNYLSARGQADLKKTQKAGYIKGILKDRAKSRKIEIDTNFTTHTRTGRIMGLAQERLGLVPIYLARTVCDLEL